MWDCRQYFPDLIHLGKTGVFVLGAGAYFGLIPYDGDDGGGRTRFRARSDLPQPRSNHLHLLDPGCPGWVLHPGHQGMLLEVGISWVVERVSVPVPVDVSVPVSPVSTPRGCVNRLTCSVLRILGIRFWRVGVGAARIAEPRLRTIPSRDDPQQMAIDGIRRLQGLSKLLRLDAIALRDQ